MTRIQSLMDIIKYNVDSMIGLFIIEARQSLQSTFMIQNADSIKNNHWFWLFQINQLAFDGKEVIDSYLIYLIECCIINNNQNVTDRLLSDIVTLFDKSASRYRNIVSQLDDSQESRILQKSFVYIGQAFDALIETSRSQLTKSHSQQVQWVFEHVNNSLKCQNSVSMTEKSEQQLNTPKETTPKQQNINFMRSQGTNQDLSLKDLGDSQTVDVQDLMLQNNVNVKVTRGVIIQINVKPNQQTCECPNQKDLDNSGVTQKYIDKQTLDENYQRQVVARSKFPQMSYDQLKQHLFICTQTSIENFPKPIIKQSTQQKTESQLKQLEIFSSILQVSEIDSYFMYSSESKLSQEVKNSIQKAMMNPQNKKVQYIPRGTQNVSELAILSYLKLLRYCQNVIENNLINKEATQDWHEKDFYEKVRTVIHAQGY
ncbi:Hypothetical_protein [Hexamita inflata]|uniref:Hypothetical_protein n=1 Tax=Hexamita inflata TaxID=28002 RepID=A0AA86R036_9EUKA|nr:Hypothetical protein HINF_LOCUS27527 [Hexamita inflata]CAI9963872.1 Hypothetical protein HINF_LOCUS51517 [Hexamita inflata]